MSETYLILIGGLFLLLILLFYTLFSVVSRKRRMKKRINIWSNQQIEEEQGEEETKEKVKWTRKAGEPFDEVKRVAKYKEKLRKANADMTPGQFFIIRLMAAITLVLLIVLSGIHWLFYIPAAVLGFWIPVFWLNHKVEKRMQRASHQLAEALGTMSNSMRAGFSFMQAMKMIAEEYPDPLGPEFKKTLQDIQYGVAVEDAFQQLLHRLPDRELQMTVKAMMIQRTAGGNLAELFDTIQETVMGRLQIKDEVRTMTAQGRMSTWIIIALPIGLAFYLSTFSGDYFNIMYTHPLGIVILVAGSISILIGYFMLRKIVRIEV
ncbi:hypothetical protein EQV77_10585 [Halobacillus fulvus]|nr:hypothetical protein EQV77_10585 [Halobacillus fulvus]